MSARERTKWARAYIGSKAVSFVRVLLDAIVATRPRVSNRAMSFEAEFFEPDGSPQRIHVIVPNSTHNLNGVTRLSRVLIGGRLHSAIQPYIVAYASTILFLSPEQELERASPRVHDVSAHWRLLRNGKSVRIRAHTRGRVSVDRKVTRMVDAAATRSFR